MLDRLVHRMAVVGGPAVCTRFGLRRPRAAEALAAVHRLVVDERVVPAVHRDQQLPLFLRPALGEDARHRVARRAGVGRVLVRRVGVLDQPPFGLERNRPFFVRREPLVVGQILQNRPRVGRIEAGPVERDHPLDGPFPVLGRCAAIGDARHPLARVGRMARSAFRANQITSDRNAFIRCAVDRRRRRGCLRAGG